MKMKKTDSAVPAPPELTRRIYSAPRLVYYGDVTQLTRAKGGAKGDGGASMSMA